MPSDIKHRPLEGLDVVTSDVGLTCHKP